MTMENSPIAVMVAPVYFSGIPFFRNIPMKLPASTVRVLIRTADISVPHIQHYFALILIYSARVFEYMIFWLW